MQVDLTLRTDKADLALVDALARVQLDARRRGWKVEVRVDSGELVDLLELAGMTGVISVEVRR